MVLACRETFPTILQRPANRIAKKVGGATPICARVLLRLMADDCFTHGASAQRRVFAQTRPERRIVHDVEEAAPHIPRRK